MDTESLRSILSIPATLESLTSYADALTAAIRRKGDIEIDGLKFQRVTDLPTDYVSTGRHTMVYRLLGTAKEYRVSIEPVLETDGNKVAA